MPIKDLAIAAATCVLILGIALVSNALLDRYQTGEATVATAPEGSACVDAKGHWVNWPWANVPMLSPRCPDTPAGPPDKK
ncbi:hypothetical protein [Bradyrhizobium sp. LHD-71]|uniref:hypothetical protein n=1 Tax=Bradyrhizobium sp. LHD-71 TaxID=3072141 RepID=UPI00280E4D1E|nr:hypothetical protein [Bradyrhizobium sp. LHD-71]MDQ8726107.1 hypothetical protein [Bradyrhizobium sp. LHD-71]